MVSGGTKEYRKISERGCTREDDDGKRITRGERERNEIKRKIGFTRATLATLPGEN